MFSKIPTDFNPKSTYINYPVIPQGEEIGRTLTGAWIETSQILA